ncbi:unnamed protein product [Thlaspi arvense]|uniref:Protein kinase domain-containing protein n=1 Tax=Thlaspi arvense TaxID=13288 RepID=A0AAU9RGX0_THLAR|nr:unnamed protein product [Thlaspi arvense]
MVAFACHLATLFTSLHAYLALFFSVFFFLNPSVNSIHFQLNRFDPSATDIVCEGDAIPSVGEIEFNKVNYINRVGWAVYAQRVRIWDLGTKKLTDFTTHYSFIIETQGRENYGHGLVFFLAPLDFDIPPNSAGGFLGLFNTTTSDSPKNQIVTVGFDSFGNTGWDPSYEHVGINNNSISSAVTTPWNASLHSGDTANVWITYNASTQNLSVFWSYDATPTPPVNSSLSYRIDLREAVSEWVKVGFSAATGQYVERHRLKSWEFNSTLDTPEASGNITKRNKGRKEYITEVKIISRLRHRNLVQLVGWCHERGEFLLVYEFMPNGSLDNHLFSKNRSPLTWIVRYKIALGLASALLYLHEEWEQCVVHRDIKSSNVMLDSSFNVKLGDFGLARFMDHEVGPQTTGLAGTFGYMAPEYIRTRRASKESDVFSFGVVALEIATGRKSLDPLEGDSQIGLVEWVWDLYGKEQLQSCVDERLHTNFDAKQVECLMIVGLWCAHPDRSLRPSIRQAMHVLNFEAAMPSLPTKMPVPVYHAPSASTSSGEPSITYTSIEMAR